MGERRYDYIIVGGGSAGSALANRLSADRRTRVLVLEAGRPDYRWDPLIQMPAALSLPIGNPRYDWMYESEPEPDLGGRRIHHARGKVLGGSSSINGMIFQRGNPRDYDSWARQPGLERWDYAHCLPYFKRMETCLAGADAYRGGLGPLVVERGAAEGPLFRAFFAAAEEAGHARTRDVNGYQQEGFAAFDRTIHRGRRLSASRAYLHPVRDRPNLEVKTRAHACRVRFEGKRAAAVEYRRRGRRDSARGGEVILCAGAIGTPQLLQLSGIGDAAHLEGLGIEPRVHLPAVGENLQDHLEVYVQYRCAEPVSMQPYLDVRRWPLVGLEWLLGRGAGTTNHFEAGGFIRSNPREASPNLMFHFLPLAVRYDGSVPVSGHGYQVHVGPMYSDARGRVRIVSADPGRHPELLFRYLSTQKDRREWVEAVRCARHIMDQPALAPFKAAEISPGEGVQTDQEILEWVAREAETAYHPSCTARMGQDDGAVVNPDTMEVHGLEGLRVVDASVMPAITNANILAPVMMIAEKAADTILGKTPLSPEDVEVCAG